MSVHLAPRSPLALAVALGAALSALAACDIETTPSADATDAAAPDAVPDARADADADAVDPSPGPAQLGFARDPYAIGAAWYDYDGATHVLTPRPIEHLIVVGDEATLLRVDGYYDDRGESGFLSFTARVWDGAAWSPTASARTSTSIKTHPVCVAIDPGQLAEVDCASDRRDLVARVDVLPIPAAGFAVGDPALYTPGHHSLQPTPHLHSLTAGALDDPPPLPTLLTDATPRPSAQLAPTASHLWTPVSAVAPDAPAHVIVQGTADMQLVQWQRLPSADPSTLTLTARCVPLAASPDDQAPLSDGATRTLTLTLQPDAPYHAQLIDLCDAPTVVDAVSAPYEGLWPRSDAFDLLVETVAGQLHVRPAPGALIWDATPWGQAPTPGLDDVEVPRQLWEP